MPADEIGFYRVLQATKDKPDITFECQSIFGALEDAATTKSSASGVRGSGRVVV